MQYDPFRVIFNYENCPQIQGVGCCWGTLIAFFPKESSFYIEFSIKVIILHLVQKKMDKERLLEFFFLEIWRMETSLIIIETYYIQLCINSNYAL